MWQTVLHFLLHNLLVVMLTALRSKLAALPASTEKDELTSLAADVLDGDKAGTVREIEALVEDPEVAGQFLAVLKQLRDNQAIKNAGHSTIERIKAAFSHVASNGAIKPATSNAGPTVTTSDPPPTTKP